MVGNQPSSKMKGRKRAKDIQDKNETSPKKDSTVDESIVSKPIETSISGLCKAIKVLETGTTEVRNYLKNECDIVLECRVCRSLFRSLANFIIHKRKYCMEIYCQKLHRNYTGQFDDDEEWLIKSDFDKNDDEETNENNNSKPKDLSSIIDRLAKRKTDYCKMSRLGSFEDSEGISDSTINLQSVEGTDTVMFQTMLEKVHSESELMKNEVMELHDMTDNDGAVIGPDGHCLGFRSLNDANITSQDAIRKSLLMGNTCVYCNMKFSTRKTLKYHINSKHNETRIVYPCPECQETFVNLWGVLRHLYKVHRKTAAQVRKLRDTVQSRAFRMDQAPAKRIQAGASLAPVLTEQQRRDEENKAWMDNLESDNDFQCCGGCGRRFERRAALNSHSQICQKRIAARNNFSGNKVKQRIMIEDEKQTKSIKGAGKRKSMVKKIILASPIEKSSSESNSPASSRPQSVVGNFEISEIIGCDPLLLSKSQDMSRASSPSNSSNKSVKLVELSDPLADKDNTHELEKDPLADYTNTTIEMIECSVDPMIQDGYEHNSDSENRLQDHFIIVPNQPTINENNISKDSNICTVIDENSLSTSDVSMQHEVGTTVSSPTITQPKYINDFFGEKIKRYVEIGKKYSCVPCSFKFSTLVGLRKHMANHFNWKRFRCIRCDYICYDKRPCIVHAQTVHHASLTNIKKYVLKMPLSDSIKNSSEVFLPIDNTPQEVITLDDSDGEDDKLDLEALKARGISIVQVEKQTVSDTDPVHSKVSLKKNEMVIDESVKTGELSRELIMEMIGINEMTQSFQVVKALNNTALLPTDSKKNSKESESNVTHSVIKTRPVRNRVKPVNKDFIYDMSTIPRHDNDGVYFPKTYKRKSDDSITVKSIEQSMKKKKRLNSKMSHNVSPSEKSDNSSSTDEPNTSIKIVPVLFTGRTDVDSFNEINDTAQEYNKNSVFEKLVEQTSITDDTNSCGSSQSLSIDNILSIIT